jgi:hypothetical protein
MRYEMVFLRFSQKTLGYKMLLLLDRGSTPVGNPSWGQVEDGLLRITPRGDGVTLRRQGNEQIKAQGARLWLTITFWPRDDSPPLMVGRRQQNGAWVRPTLCSDRVPVGPYETWSATDALGGVSSILRGGELGSRLYSATQTRNIRAKRLKNSFGPNKSRHLS